jgi:rhodanese-related sulfurtransferase
LIAAVVALCVWGSSSITHAQHVAVALSAPDAYAESRRGQRLLIDIRAPEEWRETGVARGALRITIHHPRGDAGFIEDVLNAVGGDRARPIAVICATGSRSSRAAALLAKSGFADVRDVAEGMRGGFLLTRAGPGWIARGLPVEPCRC